MPTSLDDNSRDYSTDRTTLEAALTLLDRERLRTLVLRLAARGPQMTEAISEEIARLPASVIEQPAAGTAPPADIAPEIIRKSIQSAIRNITYGGDHYYYDDDNGGLTALDNEVSPWLEAVRSHILVGESREVFPALAALTEALVEAWPDIEDMVGDMSDLSAEIGSAWAEALLTAALSEQEREDWAETLEAWQKDGGYNFDGLEVAVEAADRGWDDPPLMRVLLGESTEQGVYDGEPPDCAQKLAVIRLDILERQGRLQEAIFLAAAEGPTERYLNLLVKGGRPQEALEKGVQRISDPDQALRLARTLAEHNEPGMALTIAEHGMDLQQADEVTSHYVYRPSKKPVADWLRDQALLGGKLDLAIRAAMVGIKADPLLADYRRLQEIAGPQWPPLRQEILDFLHGYQGHADEGIIDILLLEERRDDAMRLINKTGGGLLKRVLEACVATHPDQVITIARKLAENIMNEGRSKYYDEAAEWLKQVRDAYRASERTAEWQTYRNSLLDVHGRKYKLVPLLRAL